jgi:nucleotide-binding universal stress UspA family protein
MNRVLVGVDASSASVQALRRAVEEARLRGAVLEILYAFHPPEHITAFPVPPDQGRDRAVDVAEAREEAQQRLMEWLDGIDLDLEEHDVEWTVVGDQRPARALVERSSDADLVVVGSRGRGGFRGLRLGSVSEQVTRHAHCAVLVTRPRD